LTRKVLLAVAVSALSLLGLSATAEAATPIQLVLSQSAAFSILGHSCGGIQEQAFATGFDRTTGDPLGDVYMKTSCGGSGRGGGYHSTTYSAWASVNWSFSGGVVSYATTSAVTVSPTFSAFDAHGDKVYNQNNQAYLTVVVPAAPATVTAAAAAGQFRVSWTPDPTAPAALITSSTVTATPVGSTASVVTTTVTGSGASALIGPLQPQTTYQLTVVSTDAAGSSAPSAPITVVTGASAAAPGAPTGVTAHWTAPGSPSDTLAASWQPGTQGDSPTDQHQITITGSDGGGTFTQTVSGSTLTATFAVSDGPDWNVQVRAHDAAGWGAPASFTLGGA
jgi:hypothetical protein